MPSTTNFGWTTPADTDLVKDGASAIRTLGNGIDASFVDLKGGTTGQVLSKASNTDLDFTWTAGGDITGVTAGTGISGGGTSGDVTITNSMATAIDAKGDLIAGTGADTFSRLAVGSNGQYLVADSSAATGLKWQTLSAGGMTEIASGSLSGSATIRLQSIPQTYKFIRLYIRNHIATNTNLSLRFRLNNDSSANVYASGGETGQNVPETFRYTSVYCTTDLSNTTAQGMAVFTIYDYTNTSTWKMFDAQAIGNNKTTATSIQLGTVLGAYNQTGAITEIDIFSDQGNWTGGTYNLYGVN